MENLFEVFCPINFQYLGVSFFNAYDCEKAIECSTKKIKGLLPKPKRICRFCNSKYGEVFFKKDAHVISKLLGNKYLVSDFECDNCNQLFSEYESHLSHFIGPIRVFQKLYGLEESLKFKSPDKKIIAESFNEYGLQNSLSIYRDNVQDFTFDFDYEKCVTTIKLIKHSYSPLLVYKSILKMALSCISQDDLKNYQLAYKFVSTNLLDDKVGGIARILVYSTPLGTGYKKPFAYLYKKRIVQKKFVLICLCFIL